MYYASSFKGHAQLVNVRQLTNKFVLSTLAHLNSLKQNMYTLTTQNSLRSEAMRVMSGVESQHLFIFVLTITRFSHVHL